MNKNTKNLIMGLAMLGLLIYFIYPAVIHSGTEVRVIVKSGGVELAGAECQIDKIGTAWVTKTAKTQTHCTYGPECVYATFDLAEVVASETYSGHCHCPTYGTAYETFNGFTTAGQQAYKTVTMSCSSTPTTTLPYKVCDDSDSGKNIYTKGWADDETGVHSDECRSTSIVREYYCLNDDVFSQDITCQHGCSNGVCLNPDHPEDTTTTTTLPDGEDDGDENNPQMLIIMLFVVLVALAYVARKK